MRAEDTVDEAENSLREIESSLEEVGRKICDTPGSGTAFSHINAAVRSVQDAIRSSYLMRSGE